MSARAVGLGRGDAEPALYQRIGRIVRELHESLRELGRERLLEEAAQAIPDAGERLAWVARMTEQAAGRVLAAVEIAAPLQEALHAEAAALQARWEREAPGVRPELAADTRRFLATAAAHGAATRDQLREIMMAQDFQDLTGQVIARILGLVRRLETELVQLLLEAMPPGERRPAPQRFLDGPVVHAHGRSDVLASQKQVDELLESLGF